MSDLSRRTIIKLFFATAGIGAALGKLALMYSGGSSGRQLYRSTTQIRPRAIEPSSLVKAFDRATTGPLMYYYQNFPQLFLPGSNQTISQIEELRAHCDEIEHSDTLLYPHRTRALPAVAAVHAISQLDNNTEQIEYFSEIIKDIHDRAYYEQPNATIIEMVWQNCLTALIKDEYSWNNFYLSSNVVKRAEIGINEYLNGEEVLLHSAMGAWQFLITYRNALKARGADDRISDELEGLLNRIASTKSQKKSWLFAISGFLQGRHNFESQLPQYFEAMFGATTKYGEFGSIGALSRLKIVETCRKIADGTLRSRFTKFDKLTEEQVALRNMDILANFGIDREKLSYLEAARSKLKLVDEFPASSAISEAFDWYEKSSSGRIEPVERIDLGRFLPFRNFSEKHVLSVILQNRAVYGKLRRELVGAKSHRDAMVAGLTSLLLNEKEENVIKTREISEEVEENIESLLLTQDIDDHYSLMFEMARDEARIPFRVSRSTPEKVTQRIADDRLGSAGDLGDLPKSEGGHMKKIQDTVSAESKKRKTGRHTGAKAFLGWVDSLGTSGEDADTTASPPRRKASKKAKAYLEWVDSLPAARPTYLRGRPGSLKDRSFDQGSRSFDPESGEKDDPLSDDVIERLFSAKRVR